MRTPETITHIIFEMFHMFNGHLGQNSYRETMSNAYDKQPLWVTMGNTNNEMPFGPIAMPFHGTHHRRNTRTTPLSTSPTLVHGIYYIVYHWAHLIMNQCYDMETKCAAKQPYNNLHGWFNAMRWQAIQQKLQQTWIAMPFKAEKAW